MDRQPAIVEAQPYAKRKSVCGCPHARGTQGVIKMSSDVIAQLAGAVWDKDEWLCFLIGSRQESGLLVNVDEVQVPYLQDRDTASCSFDKCAIPKGTVGVLHSHNKMRAFFSNTDYQKFNVKFGLSIVIAQPDARGDESTLLGFDYYSEGKFKLPCGSLGVCQFAIQPADMDDWPFPVSINRGLKSDFTYLGDCDRATVAEDKSTNYYYLYKGDCGLEDKKARVVTQVFGAREDILNALPPPTPPPVKVGKLQKPWENRKDRGDTRVVTMSDNEWQEYLAYYSEWEDKDGYGLLQRP